MSTSDVLLSVTVGVVVSAGIRAFLIDPRRLRRARLTQLERKMDRLLAHFGLQQEGSPLPARVGELLAQGRKIEAIRVFRDETGTGLKEAKDAVERYERVQ